MKQFLILLLFCLPLHTNATIKYVGVKSGLRVRSEPNINSNVITTLPYGAEVIDTLWTADMVQVNNFTTYWLPVKTNKGLGYVAEVYTIPFPPPKNISQNIEQYILQITTPVFLSDSLYRGVDQYTHRTHFKNGFVISIDNSESGTYTSLTIPDITIQSVYILMSNFDEFKYYYPNDGKLPIKTDKYQNKDNEPLNIRVEKGYENSIQRLILHEDDLGSIEFIQAGNDVIIISWGTC